MNNTIKQKHATPAIGSALSQKEEKLVRCLERYSSLGVAFSGGVDSTLLLAISRRVLGDRVIAFTSVSKVHPSGEKELAVDLAHQLEVPHVLFQTDELDDPLFASNPTSRCYHCKKSLFSAMQMEARARNIQTLAHGAKVDDLSDFRPGFKAADEMGVSAPLIDAGLNKADIRILAKRLALSNWDRPAMACLASRIPYGTPIQLQTLMQIDKAEAFIRQLGVGRCRVRHLGNLARIEVDREDLVRLAEPRIRTQIVEALRKIGYAHICLDLEGYVSGKMNRDVTP